jgi:hypothetical protein
MLRKALIRVGKTLNAAQAASKQPERHFLFFEKYYLRACSKFYLAGSKRAQKSTI